MGTHPIFESDFDCLTDMGKFLKMAAKLDRQIKCPGRRPAGSMNNAEGLCNDDSVDMDEIIQKTANLSAKLTMQSTDIMDDLHNAVDNSEQDSVISLEDVFEVSRKLKEEFPDG